MNLSNEEDKWFCPFCDSSTTVTQDESATYYLMCEECGHEWDPV